MPGSCCPATAGAQTFVHPTHRWHPGHRDHPGSTLHRAPSCSHWTTHTRCCHTHNITWSMTFAPLTTPPPFPVRAAPAPAIAAGRRNATLLGGGGGMRPTGGGRSSGSISLSGGSDDLADLDIDHSDKSLGVGAAGRRGGGGAAAAGSGAGARGGSAAPSFARRESTVEVLSLDGPRPSKTHIHRVRGRARGEGMWWTGCGAIVPFPLCLTKAAPSTCCAGRHNTYKYPAQP